MSATRLEDVLDIVAMNTPASDLPDLMRLRCASKGLRDAVDGHVDRWRPAVDPTSAAVPACHLYMLLREMIDVMRHNGINSRLMRGCDIMTTVVAPSVCIAFSIDPALDVSNTVHACVECVHPDDVMQLLREVRSSDYRLRLWTYPTCSLVDRARIAIANLGMDVPWTRRRIARKLDEVQHEYACMHRIHRLKAATAAMDAAAKGTVPAVGASPDVLIAGAVLRCDNTLTVLYSRDVDA
jgi:hypothetical protein